jgi:hypothetical protein
MANAAYSRTDVTWASEGIRCQDYSVNNCFLGITKLLGVTRRRKPRQLGQKVVSNSRSMHLQKDNDKRDVKPSTKSVTEAKGGCRYCGCTEDKLVAICRTRRICPVANRC